MTVTGNETEHNRVPMQIIPNRAPMTVRANQEANTTLWVCIHFSIETELF